MLKEEEQKMLEDEKSREWARQGKSKKKEKKKRKSSKPKPPVEVFETACFSFIQEAVMDAFMRSLPADFGNDHLFCVLIAQALFRLMHQWIADGMNMVPKDVMPKIPLAMQVNDNGQVVVSVDTDSEVHHFVASGIKTYRTLATKRLKRLTRAAEEREKAQKAPRSSHHRDICTMKGATGLLNAMGMLRKDIPETHDKSYDSPVLEALNRGGHLYVSPPFL